MKFYVLSGEVKGHAIKSREFDTRPEAERALERILFRENLQVEDDRFPEKHTEEFKCDQYTRFFVRRVILNA